MNKNKKTRLFVRILCGVLAAIMTLSIVVPMAYATEIENKAPYVNGEGFEYIEVGGEWYLNSTTENPVVRLINVDSAFDRDNFPILICNIDTYETFPMNLLEMNGYALSQDLKEGYYLVVGNNYAWADAVGNVWAINGGGTFYFYYGDKANFKDNKYDLTYAVYDDIIDIPLTPYTGDSLSVIPYHQTFHLTQEDKVYPLDELHNTTEILERLQNLDLEASLENGHPTYYEGYQPNTITGANLDEGSSSDYSLDDLANLSTTTSPSISPTYISATPPNQNVPVAQPEIVESEPTPNTENSSNGDVKEESAQPGKVNTPLDILSNTVEDKTNYNLMDTPTIGESLWSLTKSVIFFAILFAIVVVIYIRIKTKRETEEIEALESDLYDESRIE